MTSVSVVIPTYERPGFLPGAIESALGQTHDDLEVVVVDDGSATDYASRIVDDYTDRVRCLQLPENRGAAAARNRGLAAATGDYVAFLDDDDRWHRRKTAAQVAALDADPGAGLATCLAVFLRPDGRVMTCEASVPSGDLADPMLVRNVVGSPSRVLVRREALDGVGGFDEDLRTKQDWDLFIRLGREWRVTAVPEHLYVRTEHESLSSDPDAFERDVPAIMEKHEARIRRRGRWDAAVRRYHTQAGRLHLGAGNRRRAREHLRLALGSGVAPRRAAMYALTFVPRAGFEAAVRAKRRLLSARNGCHRLDVSAATVPGHGSTDR